MAGPLAEHEAALLQHPEVAVVAGRPGDVILFNSGAAHFAANGMGELCAAVYEGVVTPASLPLLSDPAYLDPYSDEVITAPLF